ncbi:NADH-dependent flavin oxidoreductase [Paenibacillus polymyxa]|uniref:NADH-dependent flavin oxidoreductase n=1 Tax=Paenibacillus polymyxa TaxID=1406 RepID=UPI00234A733E|nr:NADH-dependent flavin oxidoreductase [Paenibacillus polymyxa]WCM60734.1 NADH-dependent flavin oxidoreductase [Paenibacillus polymyxa]
MNPKFKGLLAPFTLKNGVTLKNRVIMAPMTTWSGNADFTISDEEVAYYNKRVNGVGLVITGCTHVRANGIGFTDEFAGYDDTFIPSLRKLASAAKRGGAPAILQIFHAGNKALPELTPNGELVSASALSGQSLGKTPRALSHEEILDMVKAFGETTKRAIEAGFDGVEIHGAHGFLIQNFFSPFFNQRTDQWGGTLENRLKFPLAVVQEVKNVIKKYAKKPFILGYRFSPEERTQPGGLRMDDVYVLIDRLVEQNVDYIHASLDHILSKPIDIQTEKTRLELITEHVDGRVPVIAAGSVIEPELASKALELGVSMVAIGRALIINPNWVELVERGQEGQIASEIIASGLHELDIPKKLWNVIQSSQGWIPFTK